MGLSLYGLCKTWTRINSRHDDECLSTSNTGYYMCIEKLANACTSYTQQISEAIEKDDELEIRRIDNLLAATFEQILESSPSSKSNQTLQADYLLGILVPRAERTALQEAICSKLLEILSNKQS